jgi:hypothetical protein
MIDFTVSQVSKKAAKQYRKEVNLVKLYDHNYKVDRGLRLQIY